ncbi:hypothetical protein OC845_000523 [Tilletia horrida]|nr:hypothetical protein OC845_000523 [Tilletia horrida]
MSSARVGPVPTLVDRRTAMHAILRAMYTDPDEGGNNSRGSSPGPARPINTSTALPIIGAAWTEQIHVHTVPVSGISILRHNVRKELEYLTRVEAKQAAARDEGGDPTLPNDKGADAAISSNAPFLENLWNCVQHHVLADPPVSDLTSYVPLVRTDEELPDASVAPPPPLKIDVISGAGRRWVRLFTLKPSSLLQEFRLVEAEEADASSDDEEGEQNLPSGARSTLNGDPKIGHGSTSFAFDAAAQRSSLMNTAIELRKAADRAMSDSSSSGPSSPIEIELILTRLDWPAILPPTKPTGSKHMRDYTEDERYRLRVHAILEELSKISGLNICTSSSALYLRNPPTTRLINPSFVPKDIVQHGRLERHLNLDLSALVALTSDIVHGEGIAPHGGTVEQCRRLFHTIPPYKMTCSEEEPDAPRSKLNVASGAHGRALAEQLWRECCETIEDGGDFLHGMIRPSPSCDGSKSLRVVLWATRESVDKFLDIVELVAGTEERKRALALFGQIETRSGSIEETRKAFWHGSKWSSDHQLLESIQLPVQVFDENPCPTMRFNDPLSKDFAQDLHIIAKRGIAAQERSSSLSNSTTSEPANHGAPSPSPLGSVPTAHTLRSLLAGVKHGMTTLTTNFTSIRWVVRQWPESGKTSSPSPPPPTTKDKTANSLPTLPQSLGLIGKYYISLERSEALPRIQEAVL